MSERRLALVNMAFNVLDRDGSGVVEPEDIMSCYDASKHPDVIAGKRTAGDILQEFLDTFDVGGVKDGKVTRQEFENYYANLSASIDNEDYFELMIRNAWHLSGGQGASANSANRRVLVTNSDGSQSVVEIKKDLGLRGDDKQGMMDRLRAQGVNASSVSTTYGSDDRGPAKRAQPKKKLFAQQSQITLG
jgi:calcyphosin